VLQHLGNRVRVSTYKAVCHGVLRQITIKHAIEAICRPLQGAAETKRYHFRIITVISVFKFVISTFVEDICSATFTNLPIICFCSQIFINWIERRRSVYNNSNNIAFSWITTIEITAYHYTDTVVISTVKFAYIWNEKPFVKVDSV